MAREPRNYTDKASAFLKSLKTGKVYEFDYGWWRKGSETCIGQGNPMRDDGTYPPSAYSMVKIDQKNAKGTIRSQSPTSDTLRYGWLGGIFCSPSWQSYAFSDAVRDKARLRVMRKLSSDFSLPVTLAEMKKTNEMIATSGITLAEAITSLRKDPTGETAEEIMNIDRKPQKGFSTRLREASRAARDKFNFAASRWLELRYGWVPILYDAWAAADSLAGIDHVKWEKVRGRYENNLRDDFHVSDGNYFLGGKQRIRFGGIETAQVTGLYRPDLNAIWTLVAKRLGLTNPLTATWELTRLSFVVDWFTPIGDWLSQLDAPLGLEFRDFTETQLMKRSCVITRKEHGYNGATRSEINWLAREDLVSMKRSVLDGPPAAALPRINNLSEIVSGPRLADAMALLGDSFFTAFGKHLRELKRLREFEAD